MQWCGGRCHNIGGNQIAIRAPCSEVERINTLPECYMLLMHFLHCHQYQPPHCLSSCFNRRLSFPVIMQAPLMPVLRCCRQIRRHLSILMPRLVLALISTGAELQYSFNFFQLAAATKDDTAPIATAATWKMRRPTPNFGSSTTPPCFYCNATIGIELHHRIIIALLQPCQCLAEVLGRFI